MGANPARFIDGPAVNTARKEKLVQSTSPARPVAWSSIDTQYGNEGCTPRRGLATGKIRFEGDDFDLLVLFLFQHRSVSGDNGIGVSGHGAL